MSSRPSYIMNYKTSLGKVKLVSEIANTESWKTKEIKKEMYTLSKTLGENLHVGEDLTP